MSASEEITIDSDSDDNEIILASDSPRRRRSSETNEEEDFIKKHERIKRILNKSKKRRSNTEFDDSSSQQSNYLAPYHCLLSPIDDDITNIPYSQMNKPKTKRYSDIAPNIDILDDLIPRNREKEDSSDQVDEETVLNKPYLLGDDTTDALQLIMDNEPIIEAQIHHEINVNDMKKQRKIEKNRKQKEERQRLQREEEENRKFAETFDKVIFVETKKEKTDSNHSTMFDTFITPNKRKRTRNEIETDDNQETNGNRRKRHKPSNTYDPNDPFSVRFPANFKLNQTMPLPSPQQKKKTLRRKKWSKSQRISRSKRNISQISRRAPSHMNIKGSTLLAKLTQTQTPSIHRKKSKKRRRKRTDPFSFVMPIMSSVPKPSPIQKNTKQMTEGCHPLSAQLQQLTRVATEPITSEIMDPNHAEMVPMSTLPHSNTHKTRKKHLNVEDIQESRTTNQDLQYLQTPQRFKYRVRNTQNELTPQIVENMITPKKNKHKRSDKEEMDASDVEMDKAETGATPKWLNTLSKMNDIYMTPNEQMIKSKKISSRSSKKATGRWQRDLRDLKLKVAHRYNLVTTYKDSIHKIPATLNVTQMITLKLLRIRRVSYYDLYQSVCVYLCENNIEYVLLYFEAAKLEELKLKQYDFIKIYRPWNDMLYNALDSQKNKKCDIRVIAGIDNVIKVFDAKTVPHSDEYPKYDINVFNEFITSRYHTLQASDDASNNVDTDQQNEPKPPETTTNEDRNDGGGDDTMTVLDQDESFWLQNIDAIIESEKIGMFKSNYIAITEIPTYELFDHTKEYNLRAMIQRVYMNEDIHTILSKRNKDIKRMEGMMSNKLIQMLVQDEGGYCCMIVVDLYYLLQHVFDVEVLEDTVFDRLCDLTKLEGIWFEFHGLTVYDKNDEDYDPSIQSLLMQFEYLYLTKKKRTKEQKKQSDVDIVNYFGLKLNEGNLLKDSKMYYHFEQFSSKPNDNMNKKYEKRLELRYFETKSVEKSSLQQTNESVVKYEASLIMELMEIGGYLKQFWKSKRSSTRISLCVRIVAKSMVFTNCCYITDNSLLKVNGDLQIQCLPLIIDNMDLFSVILKNVNDKCQPLVVLRDIAMHFRNSNEGNDGRLELRFDDFSLIDEIKDMKIMIDRRKFNYKYWKFGGQNIMNIDCLGMTPWIALNSAMVIIRGTVELVAVNDGFDVRCISCRKVSTENYLNKELEEDQCVEGVACMGCLKEKGEVRLVIKGVKNMNGFVVVCVPFVNIWYQDTHTLNGIVEAIDWTPNQMYNEELNKLKGKLNDLIGNELKQCIIEYLPNNTNSDSSIHNVKCFECFHFVI